MDTCVSKLGYIGVEMGDRGAWEHFATRILGMEEAGTTRDGGARFRMDENHHRLAVHPGSRDDLAYTGWEAPDNGALEAIAERLTSLGHAVRWATATEAAQVGVARMFEVDDPSGIATQVFCGGRPADTAFRSPRDIGGFVTGELGMGHVALCVEDYEASLRFYLDGLGLQLSDTIDVELGPAGVRTIAFLHAGKRHHSLALIPLAAPKRLHHVMFQVAQLDDVGTTFDLCHDAGVPIALTLGCHTNDRMVSFYMQSPSGFLVEYGHGGVEVDDDWQVAHYEGPSVWGHRAPDVHGAL